MDADARFDPWCLTDPATLRRWQHDRRATQAIQELWEWDPEAAATLALKAEVDAADIVYLRARKNGTSYDECPWAPLYEVRRPITITGRSLRVVD